MSRVVDCLADLRRHLDHLRELRPRVTGEESLRLDLSLENNVLFSLITICQRVIGIAGELSARRGLRFEDYGKAIGNLSAYPECSAPMIKHLKELPELRSELIYNYLDRDYDRILGALNYLDPFEEFIYAVWTIEGS
jgi:hypothetical protein